VLNQRPDNTVKFDARAYDPRTGRLIDCFTTEPAEPVYTSNDLNGSVVGSSGTRYRPTEAFTLGRQVDNQCGFLLPHRLQPYE
jgi:aldose 1-epimerase